MKRERLNLYRIDMKYIRNLHNVDNRVSSVSPQIGKQHRIYVGDKYYKQLCIDELNWCRKNADIIINKANCLYKLCMDESDYKGKERCLDFKGLEMECEKYNANLKNKCYQKHL